MSAVPALWTTTTLGQVSSTVRNGIFARRPNDEGRGERILRISAVRHGHVDLAEVRCVEGLTSEQIDRFSLCTGDLLLTRYNGSRHLVGIPGLVPDHEGALLHPDKLIRVQVRQDVASPMFVNYQLQCPRVRRFLEPRIRTTAGQSGIAGKDVRDIPLMLPRLDEQQRIVEILEGHLSRLDAADAYLLAAQRQTALLRQSALEQQFGHGEQQVPLAELVTGIEAGKSFGSASHPAAEKEWGIIKVSAMTWGAFRPEENKAVPADRVDPRYEIRDGDLLVSRANTSEYVGASVLVRETRGQLLLSDKSLRVLPRPDVNAEWLWRALQAPGARRQISAMATGTKDSMRNISQKSLLRVSLPKAATHEQEAAIQRFRALDDAMANLARTASEARTRHRSLRRSLLAAAFSGRLSGRCTDDEIIEELAQ